MTSTQVDRRRLSTRVDPRFGMPGSRSLALPPAGPPAAVLEHLRERAGKTTLREPEHHAANLERFGFFRPCDRDRGGVSPEAWHLSHVELGETFRSAFPIEVLERAVRSGGLELTDSVLGHLEEIYTRYVENVAPAPRSPPA